MKTVIIKECESIGVPDTFTLDLAEKKVKGCIFLKGFKGLCKQQFKKPYDITQPLLGILRVVTRTGINDVFWHREMKKHNAYEKRLDRPFL